MGTMKRVAPPKSPKLAVPLPTGPTTEQTVEALRARVEELETRLAELEAVISVQNQDVVINTAKSVLIQAGATVEIQASTIRTAAALTEESCPLVKVSGIVQCDTITATTVNGTTYTPGAGNVY